MSNINLLAQVRATVTVDIDSMEHEAAKTLASQSGKFRDMTSNQAIVHGQVVEQWERLSPQVLEYVEKNSLDIGKEGDVLKVINLLTVLLASQVLPNLTGRVHAQTSPSVADDTEGTIEHAKALVRLFELYGIQRDRVTIKIPATPASMVACQRLEALNPPIRTLATCLFSVPQAVSAWQAGCLYVAPYFNELGVHFDTEPVMWKQYADTVKEHPMASIIYSIVQTFKRLRGDSPVPKTLVMPASIVTTDEVVALTRLGPDHLTISAGVLQKMVEPSSGVQAAALQPVIFENLGAVEDDVLRADYLANGGKNLQEAIGGDSETARKISDALRIFGQKETETKKFLRAKLLGAS
ncbi:hypothetical protein HYDPIDRAFT_159560 [Hydnomerulius pinastri MD-312]|uniref:Unplaced genomic scaffold scaffold_28, whole genome shotgun sequence n=1 Tax=Hydnomerulius pinastri MD-312 TaxID=994086 RepID=A0A0C9VU00_9AGAM|nr:hypothetical protein HYDPIDRAFT_159560 [Hydnomerulius pinastri MD-312]